MEFLRFGSSIPGSYWGCCAVDIIQNFKVSPDDKASIEIVGGDGGGPMTLPGKRSVAFAGPTWRDIFWQRIRFGTFDTRDMPNHAFLAVLTEQQINGAIGKQWLAILREAGFEFVRAVANSVYEGQTLASEPVSDGGSRNYIFGLFRNIGSGAISDPFIPPKAWSSLPAVTPEACASITDGKALGLAQREAQRAVWSSHPAKPLLSRAEVVAAGAPVWLAGRRSPQPQQLEKSRVPQGSQDKSSTSAAFPSVATAA